VAAQRWGGGRCPGVGRRPMASVGGADRASEQSVGGQASTSGRRGVGARAAAAPRGSRAPVRRGMVRSSAEVGGGGSTWDAGDGGTGR